MTRDFSDIKGLFIGIKEISYIMGSFNFRWIFLLFDLSFTSFYAKICRSRRFPAISLLTYLYSKFYFHKISMIKKFFITIIYDSPYSPYYLSSRTRFIPYLTDPSVRPIILIKERNFLRRFDPHELTLEFTIKIFLSLLCIFVIL